MRARRRAAFDRHRVDVAEQIEDQPPPVRADVDVHPGALSGFEFHVSRRAERLLDIPFRRRLRGERRDGGHKERAEYRA